jgi:hypothetical protein
VSAGSTYLLRLALEIALKECIWPALLLRCNHDKSRPHAASHATDADVRHDLDCEHCRALDDLNRFVRKGKGHDLSRLYEELERRGVLTDAYFEKSRRGLLNRLKVAITPFERGFVDPAKPHAAARHHSCKLDEKFFSCNCAESWAPTDIEHSISAESFKVVLQALEEFEGELYGYYCALEKSERGWAKRH